MPPHMCTSDVQISNTCLCVSPKKKKKDSAADQIFVLCTFSCLARNRTEQKSKPLYTQSRRQKQNLCFAFLIYSLFYITQISAGKHASPLSMWAWVTSEICLWWVLKMPQCQMSDIKHAPTHGPQRQPSNKAVSRANEKSAAKLLAFIANNSQSQVL